MSEKIVSAEELERSLAAIERRLEGADNWAIKNVRAYIADLGLLAAGFRDRGEALATLQREADGMREALLTTRAIVSEGATEGFRWDVGDWAQRLFANQARISAALNGSPPREDTLARTLYLALKAFDERGYTQAVGGIMKRAMAEYEAHSPQVEAEKGGDRDDA